MRCVCRYVREKRFSGFFLCLDEILRVIDSMQLTAKHQVATPAQWQQGEKVIITPAVSDEDAEKRFANIDRPVPYVRFTDQPAE